MAESEQKRDFFISYNKADRVWAEWIAWQLEEAGYTTFLQAWDFRPSSDFVEEMDRAAKEAERTIAVLSDDYLLSGLAKSEWHVAFVKAATGKQGALLPVRVREVELEGLLKPIVYIDLVDSTEERAKELLIAGVERERAKPKSPPRFPKPATSAPAAPRFPGSLPPIWNVPHLRNPNFTGRGELLDNLRAALTSEGSAALTQPQAVHGLGGVGKTQLATEYAYRHASDYELVWWVRSEEPAKLASDYAGLATALDLPEKDAQEQAVAVEAVRRWLEQNQGWLLVFDNVPGPEDVRERLPRGQTGHVIVTSRNPNWSGVASPLSVQLWDRDESVDFLLKRTRQDGQEGADALADALGDLPLALEQAAAYIEETECSLSHYLVVFKEHQSELLAKPSETQDYQSTVATTWELAFQRIEEEVPAAADLLNLCAFLASDDIPLDLIRAGAEHLPDRLATAVQDSLALDKAIAALLRYSLVERSGDALSVHRLVQAVARDRLAEDAGRAWVEAALGLVNDAFPSSIQTDMQTWPVCSVLLPHALAAAGHAEELELGPKAGGLFNRVGMYLRERAQFTDAKVAYERALRIVEAAHGPDHPDVAINVNNLGHVLYNLGDLAGARAHFERALRIDEAAYGPDHHAVAIDVNNMGYVLVDEGNLAGARAHFERALEIDEAAYGPDHPSVGIRLGNLGDVLRDLGDLQVAKDRLERALVIHEAAYGTNHPYVAVSCNKLGSVLRQLGEVDAARSYYERAFTISRHIYGEDHPQTLAARSYLDPPAT